MFWGGKSLQKLGTVYMERKFNNIEFRIYISDAKCSVSIDPTYRLKVDELIQKVCLSGTSPHSTEKTTIQ